VPEEGGRPSAVLMLFGAEDGTPDLLLTQRADTMRRHPGQVSFPGGAQDATDDGPVAAALREAQEEAGIDPAGVRILATLQELFLGPSDNLVVPVVGWWDDPRDVTTGDPQEVARVARVPLAELVDPANRFRVRHPAGYVGPAFGVADMVVWGFAAGLLDAVLEAAGLNRPWNAADVRPLAVPPVPVSAEGDEPVDSDLADRAAPTVAEDAGQPGSPRTVR